METLAARRFPSHHPNTVRRRSRETITTVQERAENTYPPVSVEGEDEHGKLKELSEIVVNKSTISKLSMKKLASVLAAYLVDNDDKMVAQFRKIKKMCILSYKTGVDDLP